MSATVTGEIKPGFDEVLTPLALELIDALQREFGSRRLELLTARRERMRRIAQGENLDFPTETSDIRNDSAWQVAAPAPGLIDRRVEITGPTERKMTINALNSGARVWLADLEDSNTPLWENVIQGQINLRDAVLGTIAYTSPDGKQYALNPELRRPTIVVRPRGWHLAEKHIVVDEQVTSGAIVDFALYMVTTARLQMDRGSGPYFYLPKLESYLEARLWNDIFIRTQEFLGLPRGTIRATVLIETIPAAFQMDEILYELREHSAGLNAGRWDYMFSIIKNFAQRGPDFVLPDRNSVTMSVPMMRAYTNLLVRTCHKRGAHAMGGMAAFIPSKDPAVNEVAFAKVRADKQREATDGFDGSWVAHPGMVALCEAVFTETLGDRPNQIDRELPEVQVKAGDLVDIAATPGELTVSGLRNNVDVGVRYLEAWLRGLGAVAIHNLMEDAATAEICRSQVWQWLRLGVTLADGQQVTPGLVQAVIAEVMAQIRSEGNTADVENANWDAAEEMFKQLVFQQEFEEFLTVPAYARMP